MLRPFKKRHLIGLVVVLAVLLTVGTVNSATLLYRTSNTTAFIYIITNALGSADRKFYRVTETIDGVEYTNTTVFTAFLKQLDPSGWYKYALGIDYGDYNTLDSTLGTQLAQGLTGNGDKALAELFYLVDTNGNWAMCSLPYRRGILLYA